jgi:hypothetical protein
MSFQTFTANETKTHFGEFLDRAGQLADRWRLSAG